MPLSQQILLRQNKKHRQMLLQNHQLHFHLHYDAHTHTRLSKPEELRKLHPQHRHVSAEQFTFRTRALHLSKEIYDLYDKIRAECEPCQKAAIAPSRSKTSGLSAETSYELTFIEHCQVPVKTGERINEFVILGGHNTSNRRSGRENN